MKWKVFNNNGLPARKEMAFPIAAAVAGAAIPGVLSTAGSIWNQERTNNANAHENARNREWQSEENQKQRDWEYERWLEEQQYNSPAAQMKRYKEANLNPFLLGQSGQVGSGETKVPSSPSMQGAPSSIPMQASANFQGLNEAANSAMRVLGLNADIGNQQSQMFKNVMDAVSTALKDGNSTLASQILKNGLAMIKGVDFDSSLIMREQQVKIKKQDLDNDLQQINLDIEREVGRERAVTVINDMKQRIHNSQAQESLWKTLENLNGENAKLAKAETARNYALVREIRQHIEKMKAEIKELNTRSYMEFAYGCLADAKTLTEDSIRGFYVNQMQNKALELDLDYQEHAAVFESMEGAREWMRSDEGKANIRSEYIFEHDPVTKRINQFSGFIGSLMNDIPQIKSPRAAKYTRYGHMPNGDKLVKSWFE